jgi:hypothetical protein
MRCVSRAGKEFDLLLTAIYYLQEAQEKWRKSQAELAELEASMQDL